jgi:hypothetical protein
MPLSGNECLKYCKEQKADVPPEINLMMTRRSIIPKLYTVIIIGEISLEPVSDVGTIQRVQN